MSAKQYNRHFLTVFGLLDAVLIGQYLGQALSANLLIGSLPIGDAALGWFRSFLLISLAFSAVGLVLEKRWALMLSYVQFPFRLIFVMLTFGFLSRISWITSTFGSQTVLITAIILEVVRLVICIRLQGGRK